MANQRLPQQELGASGIKVSTIGLGCMSLSGVYGTSDDSAGIALIHAKELGHAGSNGFTAPTREHGLATVHAQSSRIGCDYVTRARVRSDLRRQREDASHDCGA